METVKLTKKQMRRIIFALAYSLDNLSPGVSKKCRKEYVDLINKIVKHIKRKPKPTNFNIKSYDDKSQALIKNLSSALNKRRPDGKTRRQAALDVLRTIKEIKK